MVMILFVTPQLVAADGPGPFTQNDFACAQQGDNGGTCFYDPNASCSTQPSTPGTLPGIIPEPYNGAFTAGANNHNVAPALVAAIFTEENFTHTDPSQLAQTWATFLKQHPDPNSGWPTSGAGANGPFQFLISTWTSLGYNASDINNLDTAADAAAKYLASNGATVDKPPSSWSDAIFAYNHAQWYVDAVMEYYNFYNTGATNPTVPTTPPATTPSTGCTSGGSVRCSGSTTPASTPGLSQVRQNIVCVAEQELALWKSKPGYPTPSFSQNGYLKYSQGRTEEWCADFASWVYDQAKDPLQPDPNWNIAYVPDIQSVGEQNKSFHWHPASSGYTPKPGDLAIHGADHVNIFISSSGGTAQYIGGDQGSGPYPGGSIVSIETGSGYYDNGITGYVSPD